jgi:Fe-S-cluster containining protein
LSGYNVLDSEMKIKVKNIALEVCRKTEEADKRGTGIRIMCPLNFDGLCVLYDHRPMICRLHGIPHELQKPGHQVYYGPGCESFTEQAGSKKYYKFDRTPFYINMAQLENELRHETGINRKLKMTVAQMLIESL